MNPTPEQDLNANARNVFEQGFLDKGVEPEVALAIGAVISDFAARPYVPLTMREAINEARLAAAEKQVTESKIDSKTRLPMEEVFMDDLDAVVKRLNNKNGPQEKRHPVVLLADCVGLKKVNDTISRSTGNLLIRTVAKVLSSKKNGRPTDKAYRYGKSADEFAVVLHGIKPDEEDGTYETTIQKIINRKQQEVKDALREAGLPVDVMNLGVRIVGARLKKGDNAHEFMEALDQKLIALKQAENDALPNGVDPRLA